MFVFEKIKPKDENKYGDLLTDAKEYDDRLRDIIPGLRAHTVITTALAGEWDRMTAQERIDYAKHEGFMRTEDAKRYWDLIAAIRRWEATDDNGQPTEMLARYQHLKTLRAELAALEALWFAKGIDCTRENAPTPGVSTRDFCDAFGDLVPRINIYKAMSNNAVWTRSARLTTGTRGGKHRTMWDPVVLATLLQEKKRVPPAKLDKVFSEQAFLKPYRDKWKMYSED